MSREPCAESCSICVVERFSFTIDVYACCQSRSWCVRPHCCRFLLRADRDDCELVGSNWPWYCGSNDSLTFFQMGVCCNGLSSCFLTAIISFSPIFLRRRSARAVCLHYFCAFRRLLMSDLQRRLNAVDVIASDAIWTQCDEVTLDLMLGRWFGSAGVRQILRVAGRPCCEPPKRDLLRPHPFTRRARYTDVLDLEATQRLQSLKLQSTANEIPILVIQRDERRCESFLEFYSWSSETSWRDRSWRASSISVWTSWLTLPLILTALSADPWSS